MVLGSENGSSQRKLSFCDKWNDFLVDLVILVRFFIRKWCGLLTPQIKNEWLSFHFENRQKQILKKFEVTWNCCCRHESFDFWIQNILSSFRFKSILSMTHLIIEFKKIFNPPRSEPLSGGVEHFVSDLSEYV